jgi:hypothetical protein
MSDGFLDFSAGVGDDDVGKKSTRFGAKDDTSYRVTLGWYSVTVRDSDGDVTGWDDDAAWDKDGNLVDEAVVRFTGCERIYKKGVGYFLYKGPAYAVFGQPRQSVATILVVWPTDSDGELDIAKFAAGKGYAVQPWVFSTDKYNVLKKQNKKFHLKTHDVAMTCPENGAEYQKLTFTPEDSNLLHKLMASEKPEMKAVVEKIKADIRGVAANIHRDLARDLTVDEVREALGEEVETPSGQKGGSHAAKDVDNLLKDVL